MNIRPVLLSFLFISFCLPAFSQKIKYKELFVLLNARQFEQAEPFLKRYLKDNDDNPNAYLFMGLIYQDKLAKVDPLKQTELLISQIDSAVFFYGKAYAGLTEKEVSKNDEYYQMYNRRDLRTGKFGVTLSDVKLDVETRLKLKEKIPILKSMKSQFLDASKYYESARQLFLKIQASYPGSKELFLRADDKLIEDLNQLSRLYDSCHISFNDYKATAQSYGKTGYNQDLEPVEMKDFKKEGTTTADFYKDNLVIWDYKRWALSSVDLIEKEIKPMNDALVTHDREINLLLQKLSKDSVSVRAQLNELKLKTFPSLLKLDPQALPVKVFELKEAELDYGSKVVEDKSVRDSSNMLMQVKALKNELKLAGKIDSLGSILAGRNPEEDFGNYKHFIVTAYGTQAVLSNQIKTTREFGMRESMRKEEELKRKSASLMWIVDGADSIPLTMEVPPTSRFRPILVKEESFTAGLMYSDSLPSSGYFYTISPSRKAEVKDMYSVDQQVFKKRNLTFTKGLYAQDNGGQVFFILLFSEAKINDKYPATIAKIYRTDGLAWSINYSFSQLPAELVYTESSELSVKTRNAAGDLLPVTFDKSGKEVK